MALVRRFLAAKKIIGGSVAKLRKETSAILCFLQCTSDKTKRRRSRDAYFEDGYMAKNTK